MNVILKVDPGQNTLRCLLIASSMRFGGAFIG